MILPGLTPVPVEPPALEDLHAIVTTAEGPACEASWYGEAHRGLAMANGNPFDPDSLTAASWDYPFGTRLLVVAAGTGRSVAVTVTDRGPAHHLGRCVDLSAAAFALIADPEEGVVDVLIEVLP